jgi:outer membrane protein TolC
LREEQIRQGESRLALAQVKFSHDMASNLDVIEAETELQRARRPRRRVLTMRSGSTSCARWPGVSSIRRDAI